MQTASGSGAEPMNAGGILFALLGRTKETSPWSNPSDRAGYFPSTRPLFSEQFGAYFAAACFWSRQRAADP